MGIRGGVGTGLCGLVCRLSSVFGCVVAGWEVAGGLSMAISLGLSCVSGSMGGGEWVFVGGMYRSGEIECEQAQRDIGIR